MGGYEPGCRDIVEKLKEHGHTVQVPTEQLSRLPQTEDPVKGPEAPVSSLTGARRSRPFASESNATNCSKLRKGSRRMSFISGIRMA